MNKRNLPVFLLVILVLITAFTVRSALISPSISDWNQRQLQRIDTSAKDFSFAVFGDNRSSREVFESLVERVNSDNVLFSIDIGDLVPSGSEKEYGLFIGRMKKFRSPFLTAIGNHELEGDGRESYLKQFGSPYYSFSAGDARFIVLDDSNGGRLDERQFEWLKEQLRKGTGYRYRFVFMHVPLYDPREKGPGPGHALDDKDFAVKLNGLFDRSGITMLFCSHIHAFYRGRWGKTPYIITGGAGAPLAGRDPGHCFFHYVKVNVSGSGVSYEIEKVNPASSSLFPGNGPHVVLEELFPFAKLS